MHQHPLAALHIGARNEKTPRSNGHRRIGRGFLHAVARRLFHHGIERCHQILGIATARLHLIHRARHTITASIARDTGTHSHHLSGKVPTGNGERLEIPFVLQLPVHRIHARRMHTDQHGIRCHTWQCDRVDAQHARVALTMHTGRAHDGRQRTARLCHAQRYHRRSRYDGHC